MSGIRLRYSGLIAFAVGLISMVTGLVFVLTITRSLSTEEFGTWSLINIMISYFLISEAMIVFWTVRQVARGDGVGKTSVASTVLLATAAIPIYLLVSDYVSGNSNAQPDAMLFGAILIPAFFVQKVLVGINVAHRPQVVSYGILLVGASKILLAVVLIHAFDLGLYGALTALFIAFLAEIGLQSYFARSKLRDRLKFSELRRWMKLSWVSVFSHLPGFITNMDIMAYTLMVGSVVGVAYYGASVAITRTVLHAGRINQALYPKLLADGGQTRIGDNLRLLLYFAFPMLATAIVFSKPALYALNPMYQDGSLIVVVLAVRSFFAVIVDMFRQVLIGVESVDIDKNVGFGKMLRSKLFLTSWVWSVKSIVAIAALIAVLYVTNTPGASEVDLVLNWAVVIACVEAPFLVFVLVWMRRSVDIGVSLLHVLKYAAAALGLAGTYYATSGYLITYHESVFDFLPGVVLQFLLCMGVYVGATYAIDWKTRRLVGLIVAEIFKR